MGRFWEFFEMSRNNHKNKWSQVFKKQKCKKNIQLLIKAFPINHIILVLGEWLGVAYITLVATHSFHYYWTVL